MKYNGILTSAALLATLSFSVTPAFAQQRSRGARALRAEALELAPRAASAPRSSQPSRSYGAAVPRAAISRVASTRASRAASTRTSRAASTRASHAASTRYPSRGVYTSQSRGVYRYPARGVYSNRACRLPIRAQYGSRAVYVAPYRYYRPYYCVPAALQPRFRAVDRLSGRVHGLVLLRLPVSAYYGYPAAYAPYAPAYYPPPAYGYPVAPAAPHIHRRAIRRAALRSRAITSLILSRDRSSRSRARHQAA